MTSYNIRIRHVLKRGLSCIHHLGFLDFLSKPPKYTIIDKKVIGNRIKEHCSNLEMKTLDLSALAEKNVYLDKISVITST